MWILSQLALIQTQQLKLENNNRNQFKVNNKDARTTRRSKVFIVNSEQIVYIVPLFPVLYVI